MGTVLQREGDLGPTTTITYPLGRGVAGLDQNKYVFGQKRLYFENIPLGGVVDILITKESWNGKYFITYVSQEEGGKKGQLDFFMENSVEKLNSKDVERLNGWEIKRCE